MIKKFNFSLDWTLLFLILLPTWYVSGMDLRESQISFFQVSAIVLVGVMHLNRYVGLFLLWACVQSVFFKQYPVNPDVLHNLFFGAVIYQFIMMFTKSRDYKKYFWVLYGVLILSVLWCFRQMFQADPIFSMAEPQNQIIFSEYSGFFGLPAFLGNYAAAVFPLSFFLGYWLVPFGLIAIVFSKSTFSAVAVLAGTLFFFWFRKRLVFWIVLGVLGTATLGYAVFYDYPTGQFNRRLNVWKITEQIGFRKQFTGYGLGNFQKYHIIEASPTGNIIATWNLDNLKGFLAREAVLNGHPDLVPKIKAESDFHKIKAMMRERAFDYEKWSHVHNEFLQVFFEMGLIGVLILGFYIYDIFKRFFRYGVESPRCLVLMSCFVAILICSFGHFPFHLARLAGSYIVIMAFLDLALRGLQKNAERLA